MSVITAQILVGCSHPERGGIYPPTHCLYLSSNDNDKPVWILVSSNRAALDRSL